MTLVLNHATTEESIARLTKASTKKEIAVAIAGFVQAGLAQSNIRCSKEEVWNKVTAMCQANGFDKNACWNGAKALGREIRDAVIAGTF